jgi:hypothetical protein
VVVVVSSEVAGSEPAAGDVSSEQAAAPRIMATAVRTAAAVRRARASKALPLDGVPPPRRIALGSVPFRLFAELPARRSISTLLYVAPDSRTPTESDGIGKLAPRKLQNRTERGYFCHTPTLRAASRAARTASDPQVTRRAR